MSVSPYQKLTTGQIRTIIESGDTAKIAAIPKELLDIFYENEKARTFWGINGMRNLYNGICQRIVEDYKAEHARTLFVNEHGRHRLKTGYEKMLEEFFGTDLFLNVSGLRSKEHALKSIEQTIIDEKVKDLETQVYNLNDMLAIDEEAINVLKKEKKELEAKVKLLSKENRQLKKEKKEGEK